ncbi:MAG TPA: hypothetical protein PKC21_03390 [Oligoflexia bacterium]|nr:hypothetical protein [Oligoflexia bacterium]HMR24379.1 hypothetical protein [Oligoflexia bacterium]
MILFFYVGISKTECRPKLYDCPKLRILQSIQPSSVATTQQTPPPDANQKKDTSIEPIAEITKKNEPPTPNYDELKTIKSEQDPEIDIVNPDVKHSPDYTRDFLIDRRCPIANCIEMSLHFKNENDANFNKQQESDGQSLYTFKIRAKHDDNRSFKYLNAVIKGNSSSSKCSSIGNNTVAVLGFTSSKNPIISTQRGPLIVQDNNILIGKNDGFKIYRNEKLISRLTSPNKNFTQYPIQSIAFHLNSNSQLFFKRAGSNQCINYSNIRHFQISNTQNCNFRLEKDPNYSAKFEQSANEQLYLPANNDSNHALAIHHENCR